jgi:hypothetical protein
MMKLARTILAVLVGAVLGYGVASFKTASPAVAYAQVTSSPIMCSNGGSIPGGYVVVSESATSICVDPNGNAGYMLQLKKLTPNPNGTFGEVICTGTPVPGGYVTTGWNHNDHVCAIPGAPQLNQQSIALYN